MNADEREKERNFFALMAKTAAIALPNHDGMICAFVAKGSISFHGAGESLTPHEIAEALRAFADKIDTGPRILQSHILARGRH